MEHLTQLMVEMKTQLSSFTQNFPTRSEVNEMFRSRDEDIKELRDEIKAMRIEQQNDDRAGSAQKASWAGVAVAVLAIIVAYFK
jgi:hypothetical protein